MPKQILYADYAATAPLLQQAYNAMERYLIQEFGNPSQPYSIAREPKTALSKARQTIAECINAKPDEIYFTSGGTESDNWAVKGTVRADSNDKAIITDAIEHHAVLRSCETMERLGFPVTYLRPDENGVIAPRNLKSHISNQTRLVSIMLVNNEIGTIEPVRELAVIAHDMGAIFHTDAVQAVGHIPIDVQELGVDLLSASAHKFGGPRGIGFLYVREDVPLMPYIDGGSQEAGMRAGTENTAAVVGMATALQISCCEMQETTQNLRECEKTLVACLADCQTGFIRNGSEHHVPGNVSLSFRNISSEMLLHRLDLMGICISVGSACDGKSAQHSHVIESIGIPQEYIDGTIRITFGRDSSPNDAEKIAVSIKRVLELVSRGLV